MLAADCLCSPIGAGKPDGLCCRSGGNLDGSKGDASIGGFGIPGDICAGACWCGTPWLHGEVWGLIGGGGTLSAGCFALLRRKKPGLSGLMRKIAMLWWYNRRLLHNWTRMIPVILPTIVLLWWLSWWPLLW